VAAPFIAEGASFRKDRGEKMSRGEQSRGFLRNSRKEEREKLAFENYKRTERLQLKYREIVCAEWKLPKKNHHQRREEKELEDG